MDIDLDIVDPEEKEGLDQNEEGKGESTTQWRKVKQMQPM